MKYQIYLNKETSEFINLVAKQAKRKPCTIIKNILEEGIKAGERFTNTETKGALNEPRAKEQ